MSRGESRKTRTVCIVLDDDLWMLEAGEHLSKRSSDEWLEMRLCFETWYSRPQHSPRGLPFRHKLEHVPLGMRTQYLEAYISALAREPWFSSEFVVVSEPTLSHREHLPAIRDIELGDEAKKRRDALYLISARQVIDAQKVDPDESETTSEPDRKRSEEPDQSSEDRLAEIRAALRESHELGEQTKERIKALVERSA